MENYYSLKQYLLENFGEKMYKLSLDGGFTCPNRDGTLSNTGCIFCLNGSGDFAIPIGKDIDDAIECAKSVVGDKSKCDKYIAYFQSYSGTYAPTDRLREVYFPIARKEEISIIDIATRPDCLEDDVISMLSEINAIKPVWVELGFQTSNEKTATFINRGYSNDVFDQAVNKLKKIGINVVVHMIIGLPYETMSDAVNTARYIAHSGADGIKFQLLHILEGTELGKIYTNEKFKILSLEEYISILEECLMVIPPKMVVHRITGDGVKRNLIEPKWSENKKYVLNAINSALVKDGVVQGSKFNGE